MKAGFTGWRLVRGKSWKCLWVLEIELLAPSEIKELIEAHVVSPLGGVGFRSAKVANPKGRNRDSQRSTKFYRVIAMKNIEFPEHWQAPKYKLGQQVKQGQIVGVEYHPPGTKRACNFGEGWTYWVLLQEPEEDLEAFRESNIVI